MSNVLGTTIYAATWLCVTEQKGKSRVITTDAKVGGVLEVNIDDLAKVSKKKDINEPIVYAAFNQLGKVIGLANKNQIVYDKGVYGRRKEVVAKFLLSYPVREYEIKDGCSGVYIKRLQVNDVELTIPPMRNFDEDFLLYQQLPVPYGKSKPELARWLASDCGYGVIVPTTVQEKRKKKRIEDVV